MKKNRLKRTTMKIMLSSPFSHTGTEFGVKSPFQKSKEGN